MSNEGVVCPDCRAGKHGACVGEAWGEKGSRPDRRRAGSVLVKKLADVLRQRQLIEDAVLRFKAVGADVPARLHDAHVLEVSGTPSDAVATLAKVFARGVLAPEDVVQLQRLGINIAPVVDWALRDERSRASAVPQGEPSNAPTVQFNGTTDQ